MVQKLLFSYLRNFKSSLDNIICIWVLKQLLEMGSREQFMNYLWLNFFITYQKTLLNNMAAELLCWEMNIVTIKLRQQLGCLGWHNMLQDILNHIIPATKVDVLMLRHWINNFLEKEIWERIDHLSNETTKGHN